MILRLLLSLILALGAVACQTTGAPQASQETGRFAAAKEPVTISGRLPGPRWREVDPPMKGSLQTFETIHLPEPCQLLLYARQTSESAGEFMKAFASRLNQSGKDVVKRENLDLPSGIWFNFTAVDSGSASRIYARKEGKLIIWAMLLAPDEKTYALFAPDAERYLARLVVEYE